MNGGIAGRSRYSLPPLSLPNGVAVMHSRHWTRVALVATLTALAPLASAQELPLRTTLVDDRTVIMMPMEVPGLPGRAGPGAAATQAGVSFLVTLEGERLTYRATYLGRTHTAYADPSGPPTRLAFDTGERRFRVVSPTVLVELDDYDMLDQLVLERGALYAKAYPHLGFALIELPVAADPAEAVEFLAVDPRVRNATVLFQPAARRPMNVQARDGRPLSAPGAGGSPGAGAVSANAKESPTPDVYICTRYVTASNPARIPIRFIVRNDGGANSEAVDLKGELYTLVPDTDTPDPDDLRRGAAG